MFFGVSLHKARFLTLQANPKAVNFFPTGTKTHGQKLTKALSNPGQCSRLVNIEPINFNNNNNNNNNNIIIILIEYLC